MTLQDRPIRRFPILPAPNFNPASDSIFRTQGQFNGDVPVNHQADELHRTVDAAEWILRRDLPGNTNWNKIVEVADLVTNHVLPQRLRYLRETAYHPASVVRVGLYIEESDFFSVFNAGKIVNRAREIIYNNELSVLESFISVIHLLELHNAFDDQAKYYQDSESSDENEEDTGNSNEN